MCFNFIAIVAHCTTSIVRFKLANNNVFGLQIGGEKINNHHKNIVGPFGHLGIEMQEVVKHLARASCTYSIMVMFINVGRTFLMKTNIDGKLTLGHNQIANLCNQINSNVLSGKKPLITKNSTQTFFGYHGPLGMRLRRQKILKWN
jgi:hypothetical protein